MKAEITARQEFVEYIPGTLDNGVVYVSIPFNTVMHKCFCGCGQEVVTPLSPTDWKLTYDGQTISLDPSIGNWNFPCQSHYFIRKSKVIWAPKWTQEQIDAGRTSDAIEKQRNFDAPQASLADNIVSLPPKSKECLWVRLKRWLLG